MHHGRHPQYGDQYYGQQSYDYYPNNGYYPQHNGFNGVYPYEYQDQGYQGGYASEKVYQEPERYATGSYNSAGYYQSSNPNQAFLEARPQPLNSSGQNKKLNTSNSFNEGKKLQNSTTIQKPPGLDSNPLQHDLEANLEQQNQQEQSQADSDDHQPDTDLKKYIDDEEKSKKLESKGRLTNQFLNIGKGSNKDKFNLF